MIGSQLKAGKVHKFTPAIRLFLMQVRLRKGLPFHVGLTDHTTENEDILLPARMRQASLDSVYDD